MQLEINFQRLYNAIWEIQQIEKELNINNTIVIGDFNMNPFEDGIVSSDSFHGTMFKEEAIKVERTVLGEKINDFDLWGNLDLRNENKDDPFEILNKQVDIFEKKVNDVLFAKLVKQNISSENSEYDLATNFQIVAPTLDHYAYTLFTLYCKIEEEYPLKIEVNFLRISKETQLQSEYRCGNQQEFVSALSDILQSDDAKRIVKNLYNKSNI